MRENCLQQFESHWECLERNNQASSHPNRYHWFRTLLYFNTESRPSQEYHLCRKPERTLNSCMFEKLVRLP